MHKFYTLLLFYLLANAAGAQTVPGIQAYGQVDQADLELKQCDFEKDANAEILFDYAAMDRKAGLPIGRHTRVKVFNDFGKGFGNMQLEYYSYEGSVGINDIKAETINLENGKIVITPLDKNQIFKVTIDKWHAALKFAMPNVKAGSIIDITYRQFIPAVWHFQNFIPVRYSEVELNITGNPEFKSIPHVKQPYVISIGETIDPDQARAMANIHSMPDEPYIGSRVDNLQRVEFIGVNTSISTWRKIGDVLMKANDFGYDLDRNLKGEAAILATVKSLRSDNEKIAFIFDTVKNAMKWNLGLHFYTIDGTVKAWDNRTGNSAEINMIIYHLLKKAGIKAYPVIVSTKENGKINPTNPSFNMFNNMVVYVPVDSTKNYVLDATQKYNLYNTIPENILNTFGLSINVHDALSMSYADNLKAYNMMFISNEEPTMQSVYLNAEVKSNGKMEGNAEITSYTYNKVKALRIYELNNEEKYLDSLRNHDNNIRIKSIKRENVGLDSLPLVQKVDFAMDLTGSDDNYIYFTLDLFNSINKNPFLSEERFSDIDFGYLDNYAFYSTYKLPVGYKADALPKNITLVMPDQSITFKRTVVESEGTLLVKYVLKRKKTIYFKDEYQDIHEFYKKMYELLKEQVALKKI